MFKKERSF